MLNIATPELSPVEWHGVRQALGTVAGPGCGGPGRGAIGRALGAITGREQRQPDLSPEQRAIRAFLCDSSRTRRIAEDHVEALGAYGFTRAQVEAMALVGA